MEDTASLFVRADGPGDLILGVVIAGVLPRDPAVGNPVGIQRQNQRMRAAQPDLSCGGDMHDENVCR